MAAKKQTTKKATAKKTAAKKAPAKKKAAAKKKPAAKKDGRKFLSDEQKVEIVAFFEQQKKKGNKVKPAISNLRKKNAAYNGFTDSNLTQYFYAAGKRLVVKNNELVDTTK
jgi:hypothetical protein